RRARSPSSALVSASALAASNHVVRMRSLLPPAVSWSPASCCRERVSSPSARPTPRPVSWGGAADVAVRLLGGDALPGGPVGERGQVPVVGAQRAGQGGEDAEGRLVGDRERPAEAVEERVDH